MRLSVNKSKMFYHCSKKSQCENTEEGVKATSMGKRKYSISPEICTRFCCALLCCGYAIVHNEFTWSIYPYSSGLLRCHSASEVSLMHYDDVIMDSIASQTTSLTIVYSTVLSGADQSKHQSSASLAFVWEIHRWPVNFPHKWPVTRKMFPFDDVIMEYGKISRCINTTKQSKAKTVCIFLGIYCTSTWVAHGVIMLFALKVTNNICKPYTTRALLIMRIFISFDLHSVYNTLGHEQNIRYIKDISSSNPLYSYFGWSCHVSLNRASTSLVGSVKSGELSRNHSLLADILGTMQIH